MGALAALAFAPAVHAAPVPTPPPDPQSVTVSIPDLAYAARDDVFRVGPFPSLLDVLGNDSGPRAATSLQLLDDEGRPVPRLRLPRVGVLTISDGYLRLDPAANLGGTAAVRYRAASPQGGSSDGSAVIVATRAISVLDDRAQTRAGQPVTVPVASNDTLLVTGAYRVCGPRLSATEPTRPDVVVVVPPEPGRPAPRPCPPPSPLTTPQGTWTVADDGTVGFSPAADTRGSARVWYSQDADYPYDVGTARVRVVVSGPRPTPEPGATPGGTTSPGATTSPSPAPSPSPSPSGEPSLRPGATSGATPGPGGGGGVAAGGPTGPLAFTGSSAGQLLLTAAGLVGAGALLLLVRRPGRPRAAGLTDGPITSHR